VSNQILTFLLLCSFSFAYAQPGCTDPQATNFDATAMTNDGSCLYPATSASLPLVADLPSEMEEISGLAYTSSGLWAHNDGGNANEIYEIDSLTGAVLHTALVIGDNEDWEDMAESEDHIFLGDFGNNPGNRTDLKIYRLNKSELGNNIMNTELIEFSYSDQTDFSENMNNNDYDCEAFFYHNDSLHLFTKNWVNNQTRHYVMSAEPGIHVAQVRETFNTDGLITGADINDEGTIVLLGYTGVGFNFIWILFDYTNFHYFSGNKRRIEYGTALTNSQTEGIAFKNNNEGFIGSEQFDVGQVELPPKLLTFSIADWVENDLVSSLEIGNNIALQVYPNPFDQSLHITLLENQNDHIEFSLINALGNNLWSGSRQASEQFELNGFVHLAPGFYTLIAKSENTVWQKRLVKQ